MFELCEGPYDRHYSGFPSPTSMELPIALENRPDAKSKESKFHTSQSEGRLRFWSLNVDLRVIHILACTATLRQSKCGKKGDRGAGGKARK